MTSEAFGSTLLAEAGDAVGLCSNSILNTDEIPLEALTGFGDLIARSVLGLITIGSGRLPAF